MIVALAQLHPAAQCPAEYDLNMDDVIIPSPKGGYHPEEAVEEDLRCDHRFRDGSRCELEFGHEGGLHYRSLREEELKGGLSVGPDSHNEPELS